MAKYDPLKTYLAECRKQEVTLSFTALEQILGASLPRSARIHSAWWGNEVQGAHVQSKSWLVAGYKVSLVRLSEGSVPFRRVS